MDFRGLPHIRSPSIDTGSADPLEMQANAGVSGLNLLCESGGRPAFDIRMAFSYSDNLRDPTSEFECLRMQF